MGRVRRSDRRQACPGLGEGVPARPASSPRTASTGRRSPAHPKAGSSHRCWPTSPCPSSTSTSPRRGKRSAPDCDARQAPPRRGAGHDRLVRYADDFVVMVAGDREPTPKRCGTRWQRCSPRWACACRRRRRGSATSTRASTSSAGASSATASEARTKQYVYTYPSKKALASSHGQGADAAPARGTHRTLADLLRRLNPVLRGWSNYFRHGVSKRDLQLPATTSPAGGSSAGCAASTAGLNWKLAPPPLPPQVVDRRDGGIDAVRPRRGRHQPLPLPGQTPIPTPWSSDDRPRHPHQRHEHVESRMRWKSHVRFGGRAGETDRPKGRHRAPVRLDHTHATLLAEGRCADQGRQRTPRALDARVHDGHLPARHPRHARSGGRHVSRASSPRPPNPPASTR